MAEDPKTPPVEDTAPVNIDADQYRSMILAKLRADIATKQSLLAAASTAEAGELDGVSYGKMPYWKMGGGDRFRMALDSE